MKKIGLVAAGLSVFLGISAMAQDRKIEEEWVLSDPTVAEQGKWLIGASADYLYVKNKHDAGQAEEYVEADRVGGSAVIGYGNTALMVSLKTGAYENTYVQSNANSKYNITEKFDFSQYEARLRYLFTDINFLGGRPYLLAGFQRIESDSKTTAPTNFKLTLSGTNTMTDHTIIDAVSVGAGQIWPFTDSVGLRTDVMAGYAWGKSDIAEPTAPNRTLSGSGRVASGMATLYWNIYEGLNIQSGIRGDLVALSGKIGKYSGYGPFAQIGYSYRF